MTSSQNPKPEPDSAELDQVSESEKRPSGRFSFGLNVGKWVRLWARADHITPTAVTLSLTIIVIAGIVITALVALHIVEF